MSFNAKEQPSGGKSIEPVEAGAYPARIVMVANLGLHAQEYQGKVKDPKVLLGLTYELLDEFMKDEDGDDILDKPRWISETFSFNNLENDKAKSTLRYTALDPTMKYDGDFSQLLGIPCMVNLVVNKGKGANSNKSYNNVANVSSMRAKEANSAPELVNEAILFDFYNPTEETWKALRPGFQKKAQDALDYKGSALEELVEALEDKPAEEEKKVVKNKKFSAPKEEANEKDW